jgi:hypothetical protein
MLDGRRCDLVELGEWDRTITTAHALEQHLAACLGMPVQHFSRTRDMRGTGSGVAAVVLLSLARPGVLYRPPP